MNTLFRKGESFLNQNVIAETLRRRVLPFALVFALMTAIVGAGSLVAYGHAHLETGAPAENATVHEWPETVRLQFTEPVEVGSSVFKVYPLDADASDDPAELGTAVRALFERVLPLRRDEEDRVDAGVLTTKATADEVHIALQEDAAPGTYVVMWRVLSVDTHVVAEYYAFTYDPQSVR